MATKKVSLGGRLAAGAVLPGTNEYHFGHKFVVQPDQTLVCDMDDAFVAAEVAAGRVKLCAKTAELDDILIGKTIKSNKKTLEITPLDTGGDS